MRIRSFKGLVPNPKFANEVAAVEGGRSYRAARGVPARTSPFTSTARLRQPSGRAGRVQP